MEPETVEPSTSSAAPGWTTTEPVTLAFTRQVEPEETTMDPVWIRDDCR